MTVAVVAAAGLGVDVAVAGIDKASGLAGVIAAFCELVAVVLAIAGRAGQRRSTATRARQAPSAPEPTGDGDTDRPKDGNGASAKYAVDASHAEGVQIGDGNTQYLDYRRSSPEQ